MSGSAYLQGREVLSPRSANLPPKTSVTIKKMKKDVKSKEAERGTNPDRIDDKWRPADVVKEPGLDGEAYITGRKLGKGGFAVCFEGHLEKESKVYALKVVKSKVEQKKQLEKFRTELQIHAKMQHPHIVEFYRAFSFEEHTYVVLELCPNGSLMEMVKNRGCLSLPEVRRYMIQLCGGVKYMHQRGVIHRDLKMGNIFLDSHMDLKIGDFGLAAVVLDDRDRRTTLCGTPNYIAPEILAKTKGHDHKVDTWAVGVICYAMLIGTPPFASKTQPEIYAKLKHLQYEWKMDGKNFIPPQAKDLVTSCLILEAAQRPDMDDLVEHAFFKMGAIAEELDRMCCRTTPMWLELADPRGDKVTPGNGVDHSTFCQACGVGKTSSGMRRPSVGGNASRSAIAAVDLENREGHAPTIPLPAGMIYKQFAAAKEDWMAAKRCPIGGAQVRSRKMPAAGASQSFDLSDMAKAMPDLEESNEAGAMAPPRVVAIPASRPRPVQSFAAQQRQQAFPASMTTRAVRPVTHLRSEPTNSRARECTSQAQGYLRERPLRSATVRVTRSQSSRDSTEEAQPGITKSSTISTGITVATNMSGTQAVRHERPATIGRSTSRYHPPPRASSRTLTSEDITLNQTTTSSSSSRNPDNILQLTTGNDRRCRINNTEDIVKTTSSTDSLMETKRRVISPKESAIPVYGSTPSAMLTGLRALYTELTPVRTSSRTRSAAPTPEDQTPHPVIQQWVDYTDKYGVGYILSDDTVGLVLKSAEDNAKASSCIVSRNAKSFYRRRCKGLEGQLVAQGPQAPPVEFYETCGERGMLGVQLPAEKFQLDNDKHPDSATALSEMGNSMKGIHDAQKARMVILLDKFAKYMVKSLGADENEDVESGAQPAETSSASTFLKFYQRLGNVGIFGFGNGALQFNFPDHTKIVVYSSSCDGPNKLMLDLYHLQAEDANALAEKGAFPEKSLQRRGIITLSVRAMLEKSASSRDGMGDLIKNNEVKEKLAWVRGVVGCWIKNGGLGRMSEERIGWTGLGAKHIDDVKSKLVWVCVGREGGDGEVKKSV